MEVPWVSLVIMCLKSLIDVSRIILLTNIPYDKESKVLKTESPRLVKDYSFFVWQNLDNGPHQEFAS